jgi:hypothetical protein
MTGHVWRCFGSIVAIRRRARRPSFRGLDGAEQALSVETGPAVLPHRSQISRCTGWRSAASVPERDAEASRTWENYDESCLEDLHGPPRRCAAADRSTGRGVAGAVARTGARRRCTSDRANFPVSRLPGSPDVRAEGRRSQKPKAIPEHKFRLGLCDGVFAHQEDQGVARERFHHGDKDRPVGAAAEWLRPLRDRRVRRPRASRSPWANGRISLRVSQFPPRRLCDVVTRDQP